ncbi:MAG TPA: hypothetical protein VFO07_07790 [Roseiflexaceae bacterium]|nr:hypothetical protein [Roseiflexaceae bacterium]
MVYLGSRPAFDLPLGKESAIFVRHVVRKHQLYWQPSPRPHAASACPVFGKAFFEMYGVASVV